MLAVIYSFIDMEHFINQCRRVYFNMDDITDATFIYVMSGLAYLFLDCGLTSKTPEERAQYDSYCRMCQKNLETVLSQVKLLMPVTMESLEALLMAVSLRPPFMLTWYGGYIEAWSGKKPGLDVG